MLLQSDAEDGVQNRKLKLDSFQCLPLIRERKSNIDEGEECYSLLLLDAAHHVHKLDFASENALRY